MKTWEKHLDEACKEFGETSWDNVLEGIGGGYGFTIETTKLSAKRYVTEAIHADRRAIAQRLKDNTDLSENMIEHILSGILPKLD